MKTATGKTKPQPELRPLVRAVPAPTSARAAAMIPSYGARLFLPDEWRGWTARSGAYGFMQELEARDAHLAGVLHTRRSALAAAEMRVVDTDDSAQSREIGQFVREVVSNLSGLRDALNSLLDAFGKGWALAEVMWRRDPDGRVRIDALVPRRQERFAVDAEGQLWLTDRPGGMDDPALLPDTQTPAPAVPLCPHPFQTAADSDGARPMPPRKFCRFVHEPTPATPYGTPLTARVAWLIHSKMVNLMQWGDHNTYFVSPMHVAKIPAGLSAADEANIRAVMENRLNQAGVILPKNVEYETVEPSGNAVGGRSFRELMDWCNDEISKVVLGQTLTSGEGRRAGSNALGSVHERVLAAYHEADALSFGEQLTAQISRWLTDFNFGTDAPAPAIVFETRDPQTDRYELEIDEKLLRMGVPLSASWFYRRYRRPVPAGDDHPLRYDDQNLFQYHLHYGVLTVNEAREKLGLPPVSWGNCRSGDSTGQAPQPITGVSVEEAAGSQENHGEQETEPDDTRESK